MVAVILDDPVYKTLFIIKKSEWEKLQHVNLSSVNGIEKGVYLPGYGTTLFQENLHFLIIDDQEPVKTYAIWRNRKVIGYCDITENTADKANRSVHLAYYFGDDRVTNPEKYCRKYLEDKKGEDCGKAGSECTHTVQKCCMKREILIDEFEFVKDKARVRDIQGKGHTATVVSTEQNGKEVKIDTPRAVYCTKSFYHFGSFLDKVTPERTFPDYWETLEKGGYPSNEVCYCRADHNGYHWFNRWFRIYGTKQDAKEMDAVYNEIYDNIANLHMLRLYLETHCTPVKKEALPWEAYEWKGFLSGESFDYYFRFSLMKEDYNLYLHVFEKRGENEE